MTDPTRRQALVAAIHDTDARLVLAVAGGGNAVITDLLDLPGASRTVLEIVVPYAQPSLVELLAGHTGGRAALDLATVGAVSQTTAEAMAASCRHRAQLLAHQLIAADGPPLDDDALLIGVACTAALASDRPKRGEHRAHVAAVTADGVTHRHVALSKGALDRAGEDRVVADVVLEMIAETCGVGRELIATLGDR